MREKDIIVASRILSMVFTPFYLPIMGLVLLFIFSYMSLLPWAYKAMVLLMVYIFTILIPTLLIHLYRKYQGWSLLELGRKERRMVPYAISILSYSGCYYLMTMMHIPRFMNIIVVIALVIQVVCAIINVWWKISTHSAGIGGVAGALIAFAFLFSYNPMWWLCLVLVIAGLIGTARMILRQHTLAQVVAGFLVGAICAYNLILFV